MLSSDNLQMFGTSNICVYAVWEHVSRLKSELHERERELAVIALLASPTTSNVGTVLKKAAVENCASSQLALPVSFIATTFLQAGQS